MISLQAVSNPLISLRVTPGADRRLIWLPHAGGSAATFQEISDRLPRTIEPLAFEYAGRGRRRSEQAKTDLLAIAREVAIACRQVSNAPYALFGHSMGAVVALEACRFLRLGGLRLPDLLIVSGRSPPHRPSDRPPLHGLQPNELLQSLTKLGGIPPELLAHNEILELALPVIRADIEACERHNTLASPKLPIKLVVYGGSEDEDASFEELKRWGELTSLPTSVRLFRGGHFYIYEDIEALIASIVNDMNGANEC